MKQEICKRCKYKFIETIYFDGYCGEDCKNKAQVEKPQQEVYLGKDLSQSSYVAQQPNEMKYKEVFDRMLQMERVSGRNPNLMQTYEVMWNALKLEIQHDKI